MQLMFSVGKFFGDVVWCCLVLFGVVWELFCVDLVEVDAPAGSVLVAQENDGRKNNRTRLSAGCPSPYTHLKFILQPTDLLLQRTNKNQAISSPTYPFFYLSKFRPCLLFRKERYFDNFFCRVFVCVFLGNVGEGVECRGKSEIAFFFFSFFFFVCFFCLFV